MGTGGMDMGRSRGARAGVSRPLMGVAFAALVAASGCSGDSDDRDGDNAGGTVEQGSALQVGDYTVPSPDVTPPPAEGAGISSPQPAVPAAEGYVTEELFVSGTAASFEPVDTPDDGEWTVALGDEATYTTRVIVHRPPADRFSGTVIVEWFNVSAIEASPDWAYLSEQIGRDGHAYVGVSAQAQGVDGGDTLLDVEVDEQTAAAAGASTDASGLKNVDPARYGTLDHPGDAYAFDIYSQVGRAVTEQPDLLGGLEPSQVIAVGESQSAGFLTTVANAVHPLDPVYDGFLVHSRGANPAPVDGQYRSNSDSSDDGADFVEGSVRVRTDLDVPTFIVQTETDLTLLGYAGARQDDTDTVRTWEVAGTAHSDAHMVRSIIGGPRDPDIGDLLGCTEPINIGPHHEVVQAALHHLVEWASDGNPPPGAEPIELDDGDEVAIARDERQIALGGVRTPLVDVPVAATTGDPPGGQNIDDLVEGERDICALFGTTIPFDQPTLVELYGTFDAYLTQFTASADEAVTAGFLVQADADELIAEAEQNAPLFSPSP